MRRDNGQLTAASPRQASDVSRTSKAAPVLPRLTSLRWFAALAVFLVHADSLFQWAPLRLFRFGASGVTFFFILSGFVLTWSMVPNLSARTFWWRRFARIYPACFVALMVPTYARPSVRRGSYPQDLGYFGRELASLCSSADPCGPRVGFGSRRLAVRNRPIKGPFQVRQADEIVYKSTTSAPRPGRGRCTLPKPGVGR